MYFLFDEKTGECLASSTHKDENLPGKWVESKKFNIDDTTSIHLVNGVIVRNEEKHNEYIKEKTESEEASEIYEILKELTLDFIQYFVGEDVPDIEQKKAQFVMFHNRVREIQGKPPRELRDK